MAKSEKVSSRSIPHHAPFGSVAFVAFVGAFVYFSHDAHNFGAVLWAFVESIVWPGILVYHVLQTLGA